MEDTHRPKKLGTGVLIASLLVAALLAFPCAWYASYHDQLTPAGPARGRAAAPPRPSGVITLGPPRHGRTRTVQIQHTSGQVITTLRDGRITLTVRAGDPRPPSNPLDALGQSLCDRYNAWKCEKGDPRQPVGSFQVAGGSSAAVTLNRVSPFQAMTALPPVNAPVPLLPPAHAPGTRAPGSPAPPAARTPAGL